MSEDTSTVYDEYEEDVSVDTDEDRKHGNSNQTEWFKGDKGRCYRVSLVYYHTVDILAVVAAKEAAKKAGKSLTAEDIEKVAKEALAKKAASLNPPKKPDELTMVEKLDISHVKFRKFSGYYKEGLGFVLSRLGKDGAEADKAWKSLGTPKNYFTTIALFYPCDKDGNLPRKDGELDKARIMSDWYVMPWRFGGKTWDAIWAVNKGLRSNDLSINDQDLILKCENAEYQNFKITGGGKAAWKRSDQLSRRVLERASALYEKLVPFREMSTADLQIKLGISTGNKGEDVSGSDMDGLIEDSDSV
jgi:hypothetical protein